MRESKNEQIGITASASVSQPIRVSRVSRQTLGRGELDSVGRRRLSGGGGDAVGGDG